MNDKLEIQTLLQRDGQLPHEVGFAVGLAIDWKFECKFVEGVLRAVYSVQFTILDLLADFEESCLSLKGLPTHSFCY